VTPEGSYKVLSEAVEFYGGKEGDEVIVVLPLEDKKAPFAAVESVKKEEVKKKEEKPAERKVEKKPVAKKGIREATAAPKKVKAPKKEVVEDEEELR
jgi:hypothetical protein